MTDPSAFWNDKEKTIMTPTSFAFLLVKFQDINDELMTKSDAEQMFSAAGSGTLNALTGFKTTPTVIWI
jgi:hypothetical protein